LQITSVNLQSWKDWQHLLITACCGKAKVRMASHAGATFWYVLPSLPMFLLIPELLKRGVSFWLALAAGCVLTVGLYLAMTAVGPRFGLKL